MDLLPQSSKKGVSRAKSAKVRTDSSKDLLKDLADVQRNIQPDIQEEIRQDVQGEIQREIQSGLNEDVRREPMIKSLKGISFPEEEIAVSRKSTNLSKPSSKNLVANIEDMLHRDSDETFEDYQSRKVLTLKLASIPDYTLNNATAVTIASMMMKKAKLGLVYDANVEKAIYYLLGLLHR